MQIAQYYRPDTLEEAVRILNRENIKILAGGTDLVIALRERHIRPEGLLDLSRLGLNGIYVEEGALHIGSMATFHQIETNADVLRYCPMLAEAASTVGATQIRARATIGGNVANAATAADSMPPLLSMDAQAVILNSGGRRTVLVEDILAGANKTTLGPEDLILEFILPVYEGAQMAFEKIGRRRALAISRINLGLLLQLQAGVVRRAAVSVGAVGKTAYRVRTLEERMAGRELSEDMIEEACALMDEIVAQNLGARKTAPYKRRIAAAVLKRALERIARGDVPCVK